MAPILPPWRAATFARPAGHGLDDLPIRPPPRLGLQTRGDQRVAPGAEQGARDTRRRPPRILARPLRLTGRVGRRPLPPARLPARLLNPGTQGGCEGLGAKPGLGSATIACPAQPRAVGHHRACAIGAPRRLQVLGHRPRMDRQQVGDRGMRGASGGQPARCGHPIGERQVGPARIGVRETGGGQGPPPGAAVASNRAAARPARMPALPLTKHRGVQEAHRPAVGRAPLIRARRPAETMRPVPERRQAAVAVPGVTRGLIGQVGTTGRWGVGPRRGGHQRMMAVRAARTRKGARDPGLIAWRRQESLAKPVSGLLIHAKQ
jgi:hypothetical protein